MDITDNSRLCVVDIVRPRRLNANNLKWELEYDSISVSGGILADRLCICQAIIIINNNTFYLYSAISSRLFVALNNTVHHSSKYKS